MFIFLGIHFKSHPEYQSLVNKGENATEVLTLKLWEECAENLVLFAPAMSFDMHGVHNIGGDGTGYMRLSFSIATYEQTRRAIGTFADVLTKFFKV